MIEQKVYVDPILGNVFEVIQTNPEPSDIEDIRDFPESYRAIENDKPITLICNVAWIAINLAIYMREGGCNELRYAKSKAGPFTIVFDGFDCDREGDTYNKKGIITKGNIHNLANYQKITDSSNDCEF